MNMQLRSERVVVQAPMSFTGSARRAWKLTRVGPAPAKVVTVPLALVLTGAWWVLVAVWYVIFGLLLVPWRVLRRGSRRRKQDRMRHQELVAVTARAPLPPPTI